MDNNIFSIIIPAYNEEDAIADTLKNVMQAKKKILAETDIDDIEVIVVNDGSCDRTESIVKDFGSSEKVKLISFEKNRGYGCAIKEGFRNSLGKYVGFFDADNTCDPGFFVELYNALKRENAHIALGSRIHKDSKMPLLRRIGNKIYATIINILWKTNISDSASGMRMLRRDVLDEVYPLPDGLNFTPIMTCKALSSDWVKIVETNMPYEERSGKSKLSVIKDGWRFLSTILEMGISYRPAVFFGSISLLFFLVSVLCGIPVVIHYAKYRSIPDDMIYRIVTVITASLVGAILLFVNLIMKDFIAFAKGKTLTFEGARNKFLKAITKPINIICAGITLAVLSVLLNAKGLWGYLSSGIISQHWIYVLTGAFLFVLGVIIFVFGVAQHIIYVYKEKM